MTYIADPQTSRLWDVALEFGYTPAAGGIQTTMTVTAIPAP